MDHRSVMNRGPVSKLFENAKEQSTVQAQQMLGAARGSGTVPFSGARPFSAPVGTRDFDVLGRRRMEAARKLGQGRDTPAIANWRSHTRHLQHDPTMLSLAGTMPDNLQVLTTQVNWVSLLDQQRDQFDKLKSSDDSYRSMLDKYQKYQMLVQLRLEKVLNSLA